MIFRVTPLIIALVGLFGWTKVQCKDSSSFIGINVAPIVQTQIDLIYEKVIKGHWSGHVSGGFVINAPNGSMMKAASDIDLYSRSGGFIRLGVKVQEQGKKIMLFYGGTIVNSIAVERWAGGCLDAICTGDFSKTSYNLGIAGSLGISISSLKRIIIDIGLQEGLLLVNNLADFHSYSPGLGLNYDPLRLQLIAAIKYRLN